ncbi:MAG: hypothetical protein ACE5K7_02075, partial [Phycisphaerae bacterium]
MRRQFALSGLAATLAIALLATLGAITTSTTAASSDTIAPVVGSSTVPLLPSFEESTLPSSPLTIVKTADTSSAAFGDDIRFTLYLHNEASESVPALVFDPIADGTRYVPDSF